MKIFPIAFRNTVRNWRRSLITTFAMGFAGFIMILYGSITEGLLEMTQRNAIVMNVAEIQIHKPGYLLDPDLYNIIDNELELIEKLTAIGFFASSRLYGYALASVGSASSGIQLRGVDINSESFVTKLHQHVWQGSWLDLRDPSGVVIGKKLARTLGVGLGGEIVVVSQAADGAMANELYTVRGILKSVGAGIDSAGFFMVQQAYRQLMSVPRGAHEIAIMRANDAMQLDNALEVVKNVANTYEVLSWREIQPVIARILDFFHEQMLFAILIVYTAIAMLILNAMLMSVFERINVFGVMKAIGVTPLQISLLIYVEAIIQCSFAAIIAVVSGLGFSFYYARHGIDLSSIADSASFGGVAIETILTTKTTVGTVLNPVIFLFVIASIAILYPAIKAAVIQPVKAIYFR